MFWFLGRLDLMLRSRSVHICIETPSSANVLQSSPQSLQDLLQQADAVLQEEDKRIEETLAKRLQELSRGLNLKPKARVAAGRANQ